MRKIRLWIETGFAGCNYEDVIEIEDDSTDKDIEIEMLAFLQNNIDYGWCEVEDD